MPDPKKASEGPPKKKRKQAPKREWLPWEFCKLIEPHNGVLPSFGWQKPSSVSEDERALIIKQSESLFPVGFYDMTPTKRGVTKGRGDWKGKEALRLAHCSAEKNGCHFKARFCRVESGMEIFTSGNHDVMAHLTPRKRGLAPAARAIVTKYREEPQAKLVEWLKDGGLLDGVSEDLEKVKQQIKRRKMTLKRKQRRNAESFSQSASSQGSSQGSASHDVPSLQDTSSSQGSASRDLPSLQDTSSSQDTPSQYASTLRITAPDANFDVEEEEEDPLFSSKINILQDDNFISLIDPPQRCRGDTPNNDSYFSDEGEASLREEAAHYAVVDNSFGDTGPYSPTTVVEDVSAPFGFTSMFESGQLLQAADLFPRIAPEYSMSQHMPLPLKQERPLFSTSLDPTGSYNQTAV